MACHLTVQREDFCFCPTPIFRNPPPVENMAVHPWCVFCVSCVYVCMCVSCVHVCICVCACACARVCQCVSMCICVHVFVHECYMYVCTVYVFMHVCMCACVCACAYVCTCVCMCACMGTCPCMHVFVHVCVHACECVHCVCVYCVMCMQHVCMERTSVLMEQGRIQKVSKLLPLRQHNSVRQHSSSIFHYCLLAIRNCMWYNDIDM